MTILQILQEKTLFAKPAYMFLHMFFDMFHKIIRKRLLLEEGNILYKKVLTWQSWETIAGNLYEVPIQNEPNLI